MSLYSTVLEPLSNINDDLVGFPEANGVGMGKPPYCARSSLWLLPSHPYIVLLIWSTFYLLPLQLRHRLRCISVNSSLTCSDTPVSLIFINGFFTRHCEEEETLSSSWSMQSVFENSIFFIRKRQHEQSMAFLQWVLIKHRQLWSKVLNWSQFRIGNNLAIVMSYGILLQMDQDGLTWAPCARKNSLQSGLGGSHWCQWV